MHPYNHLIFHLLKDWVSFGAVTRVKNQGDCGSCFAFSAVGALECLNFIENHNLFDFSEQELLDCTSDSRYGNMGCEGGLMNSSFLYVKKNGIHFEDSYPYSGKVSHFFVVDLLKY